MRPSHLTPARGPPSPSTCGTPPCSPAPEVPASTGCCLAALPVIAPAAPRHSLGQPSSHSSSLSSGFSSAGTQLATSARGHLCPENAGCAPRLHRLLPARPQASPGRAAPWSHSAADPVSPASSPPCWSTPPRPRRRPGLLCSCLSHCFDGSASHVHGNPNSCRETRHGDKAIPLPSTPVVPPPLGNYNFPCHLHECLSDIVLGSAASTPVSSQGGVIIAVSLLPSSLLLCQLTTPAHMPRLSMVFLLPPGGLPWPPVPPLSRLRPVSP